MKKTAYFLFLISILVFLISLTLYLLVNRPIETHAFYTDVEIVEGKVGFDLNNTALTFGIVSAGTSSTRSVVFSNKHEFPVLVKISINGNIKNLIRFDRQVRIESNETIKIPFTLTPSDYDVGHYEGTIIFKVIRDNRKDI